MTLENKFSDRNGDKTQILIKTGWKRNVAYIIDSRQGTNIFLIEL